MKKWKYIRNVGIFLLFGFLIYKVVIMFGGGSYAFAETYEIVVPEHKLIEIIKEFKIENPQYKLPHSTKLTDGRSDSLDYWYHFYFFLPEENEILHTWVRSNDPGYTSFAFVAVNEGIELGHWKMVNDDFSFFENRRVKKKFEDIILNKIKNKISIETPK